MSDYSDTQSARNAEYRSAYAKWVASLSPKKRSQLQAQGLLEPQVDPAHTAKGADISELQLADPAAHHPEIALDPAAADTRAQEDASEATWAALRRLVSELLADTNPALGIECLAVASGVGFLGESMTSIAKRHRVTRAAVSKRCVQWTALLQLMPSRAMRRLTARHSYRNAQATIQSQREQFDSSRLSHSTVRARSELQ